MPEFAAFVNRPVPALLVVLTGPSGVGKDVTLQRMEEPGPQLSLRDYSDDEGAEAGRN